MKNTDGVRLDMTHAEFKRFMELRFTSWPAVIIAVCASLLLAWLLPLALDGFAASYRARPRMFYAPPSIFEEVPQEEFRDALNHWQDERDREAEPKDWAFLR